jgi:CheY-like chemotaxis protein
MICDDEQDVLLTYAAMLKLDYTVVTTSSGSECIKSYVQRKQDGQTVHVILVDFKLGDMTGDEVARKIKLLNGTKIVLISAYDIDDNVVNALKEIMLLSSF